MIGSIVLGERSILEECVTTVLIGQYSWSIRLQRRVNWGAFLLDGHAREDLAECKAEA